MTAKKEEGRECQDLQLSLHRKISFNGKESKKQQRAKQQTRATRAEYLAAHRAKKSKAVADAKVKFEQFESTCNRDDPEQMKELQELKENHAALFSKTAVGQYAAKNKAVADAKVKVEQIESTCNHDDPEQMKELQELKEIIAADQQRKENHNAKQKEQRAARKEAAETATEEVVAYAIASHKLDFQDDKQFLKLRTKAIKANAKERLLDTVAMLKTVKIKTGEADPNARATLDLYNESESCSDFWKEMKKRRSTCAAP